mmetsp:Transcript_19855/g.22519  ORF Transcript_19855/g.22519 Transcript_19855/m.22519 type:complete len:365 (+) Transcript_19855:154-1248(+)
MKPRSIFQWTVSSSEKTSDLFSKAFRIGDHEWRLSFEPDSTDNSAGLFLRPSTRPKQDIDLSFTLFFTSYKQDCPDMITHGWVSSACFETEKGRKGRGFTDLIKLSDITMENFTMSVIAPTPEELSEKEISAFINPCDRYEQTSLLASVTVKRSSDYLGDREFQDATIDFASAFNQEAFHDVEFTFQSSGSPEEENSDPSKQRIFGHRSILSARCPYLKVMFTSGMKESKEMEIPVTDVDNDTFHLMLQYLYTGKLKFKSLNEQEKQEQVTRMYKAMHQYLLFDSNPDLEEFCLQQYASSLTPATFVNRLNEDMDYDKLVAKLSEYAKNEKQALRSCSEFKTEAKRTLMNGSNIPLIDIFLEIL